jgi:hypothetical protein
VWFGVALSPHWVDMANVVAKLLPNDVSGA